MSADFKIVSDNGSLIDGIMFYARLLENYTKACYGLVNSTKKPYLVDPETPIFCLDPSQFWKEDENVPKDSYMALANWLGPPISKAAQENRSLKDNDFYDGTGRLDKALVKSLVFNVFEFEKKIFDEFSSRLRTGLFRFIVDESESMVHQPEALIPPYFLLDSLSGNKWYEINKEIATVAPSLKGNFRLYMPLFITESLLETSRAQLIKDFVLPSGVDGVLLWVNNFNEEEATVPRLENYTSFIKEVSETRKDLIIMYGGFLSLSLAQLGISGVSSGMQFWNYRDINKVPGGKIPKRYYVERLHKFMQYSEFTRLIKGYGAASCSCNYCQQQIYTQTDPPLSALKGHFVHARSNEVQYANSFTSFPSLKGRLLNEFNQILTDPKVPEYDKSHMKRWASVLNAL
jgi:hypothetical protein